MVILIYLQLSSIFTDLILVLCLSMLSSEEILEKFAFVGVVETVFFLGRLFTTGSSLNG